MSQTHRIKFRIILILLAAIMLLTIGLPAAMAQYVNLAQIPGNNQLDASVENIDLGENLDIHSLTMKGQNITVCLDLSPEIVFDAEGWVVEDITEQVRQALTPLEWQSFTIQVYDDINGLCHPLSDFLPAMQSPAYTPEYTITAADHTALSVGQGTGSLAGKTIYVSAGHGWNWTNYGWRTQRVVYQGFIEDHNNAEVVDQYFIPYLVNAGAKVIPMRERDWNTTRALVDNDAWAPTYTETGTWTTSSLKGYQGGTYRYATTVQSSATAVATWHLTVDKTSEYAVYAWVKPGINRAPDAHYVIYHAGGQTSVTIDQRVGPETWRYLGTFPFYAGQITVTLDNVSASPTVSAVIADAIRVGGGMFDSFNGIYKTAIQSPYPSTAPNEPFWESAAYYYSQWMGMDPAIWSSFNDVISRPLFARWNHAGTGEDAVYISWHTNGYNGTARGTESYVFNNDPEYTNCVRTAGSLSLQIATHQELIHDIRTGWDANWIDRGKKQADLGEVRMLCETNPGVSEIPGVLFEIAYHDNPEDANALKDPRFNQLSARALYQGIVHYFETRDGVNLTLLPEPPTHLRVTNNGAGQLLVSWQSSPTDSVGLRGDAAASYRIYLSHDGFAWETPIQVTGQSYLITNLDIGEVVYVKVTGVNAGGESLPTEIMGARVGEAQLLIVNGFDMLTRYGLVSEYDQKMQATNLRMWLDQINAQDYVVHHGDAVGDFSAWDSASNEAIAAGMVNLQNYGVVDWFLGEESSLGDGTFSNAERTAINTYLTGGRGLFLSGSDIAWDLEYRNVDPGFLHNTLHSDYLADDAQTYGIQPNAGGIFAGLSNFSFNAPGEYIADFPDVISPLSGAIANLSYVGGTGGTAALQYADPSRRMVLMGFPFEVVQPDYRVPVMQAVLDFLGTRVTDTIIDYPEHNGYYNVIPPFHGTASGEGLIRVDVQVKDLSSNLYWNGAAWVGETWIPAAGTTQWSYALPALADGAYALTAKATGETEDATPAVALFNLDRTAPNLAPALFPQNGITQTSPVVLFQWQAPVGDASPLHYRLEIDDVIHIIDGLSYATSLGNGTHTWRVAATDAAGNDGPWGSWWSLTIDARTFYLPFVMHRNIP